MYKTFRKKSCKKRAYTLIKRLSPQIFTKVVTATLGNLKNHERAQSSDERRGEKREACSPMR
jgi:hypothetical protein